MSTSVAPLGLSGGAPLWLPWGILGASLAQEDFEGKTSKLAEAFLKN